MRRCCLCRKKKKGNESFFSVPKDERRKNMWSKICQVELTSSSFLCMDHFAPADIVTGRRNSLMPSAVPSVNIPSVNVISKMEVSNSSISLAMPSVKQSLVNQPSGVVPKELLNGSESNVYRQLSNDQNEGLIKFSAVPSVVIPKMQVPNTWLSFSMKPENSQRINFEHQKGEFTQNLVNSHKIVEHPQLQEELIIEIPVMPPQLQKESILVAPDSKSLFIAGSTQTNTRLCGLVETLDLSDEFHLNCFYCSEVFPLEKWKIFANHLKKKHFEMEDELKTCEYVSENHKSTFTDSTVSTQTDAIIQTVVINSKTDLSPLVDPLESTNLSCSLKTLTTAEEELEPKEECEPDSIEIVPQKATEIAFEYTPREIVELLLDSMKNYPVLWQFDDNPYNDDFYEAVEDLCKIINDKWSLNIDNLKMRRSINRILRFYCYLYPNDNIENIDQFTCYYDKCATFLPASVNEIAYARCSHCYMCYKCDFYLKPHLLEEHKILQWPYKCVQCKECFIESDEYEFHKRLPHYDESFRCEPCNKTFLRRNKYNQHVLDKHHPKEAKYKCGVCEKVLTSRVSLTNHKLIHGEKKHKCHLCPKSFINISSLRLHLKLHRRQYDVMCEICGQKMFDKASLRVHMKRHTQEKITCNICNLKLRKSSLNRHLRSLHVAYEGTIEQTLKGRHVNNTRSARPLPIGRRRKYIEDSICKTCGMNFENYDLVVEHNKEFHPDIPIWSCKMCVLDFNFKNNMKRHYRKRHKLDPIQVYKLVEENEDLDVVLAYDKEQLNELAETHTTFKIKRDNVGKFMKRPIKSKFLTDEIYFEETNNSSEIQDEIINATDNMEAGEGFLIELLQEES